MLKILKIAKLEISILFFSPVAWLILVIFTVQNGVGFFGMLQGIREALSMGSPIGNLTFAVFSGNNGLFNRVTETIYLYIPLLTMGVMSREISSGSIKLLLSSPVKIYEIIIGKYLAICIYVLLLVSILGAYSLAGAEMIKNADVAIILSGLTGILLLACTYAAIGLFMSSLTSYQVVAAISTLAVLAILRFVGGIGQDINFVRDLTYFLRISGRADDMIGGLLTSKDVIYFIIIICLFLLLSIMRIRAARSPESWVFSAMRYAGLFALVLLAGYVSSRPRFIGYLDMTATKARTLTRNSIEVLRKINGPLTITTYVNLLDQDVYAGLPAARIGDLERFEQYKRFIPELSMNYVYYYDATDLHNNQNMIYQGDISGLSTKQVAAKVADNMGVNLGDFMPPEKIRKIIDLKTEDNKFTRILEYKGKTSRLRLYNDLKRFPEESEVTAAIKRLVVPVPKIGFITGNNERSIDKTGDRNYQLIGNSKNGRNSLINQGFDVFNIDLDRQQIPGDLAALVLADPVTPLSPAQLHKLQDYLAKGGNMLITGEPGREDILNPLTAELGIKLQKGMLVRSSKNEEPDQIFGRISPLLPPTDPVFAPFQKAGNKVYFKGASAIAISKKGTFRVDTLLASDPAGWNKTGPVDLTRTDVKFDAAAGDKPGAYPITVAITRNTGNRLQKIIVGGDADFISNGALLVQKGSNLAYGLAMFKWFSGDSFPVDVSRPGPRDNGLTVKRKQIGEFKIIFMGFIPGIIVALGAFILISRKRK